MYQAQTTALHSAVISALESSIEKELKELKSINMHKTGTELKTGDRRRPRENLGEVKQTAERAFTQTIG